MKNSIRIVSIIFVLILMMVLTAYGNNKSEEYVEASASPSEFTITVVNGNKNAGNVSIYLEDGSDFVDQNTTSLTVSSGKKIMMVYTPNPGYEMFMWANYTDGYLAPTMTGTDNDQYYQSTTFKYTVKKNLTFYVYAKNNSENVVYFYDTSNTAKRTLIGVSMAANIDEVNVSNIIVPKKSGFDFDKWSVSFDNIASGDIETYPLYKSNVWTVFRDYYPMFFKGLGVTLLLSVVSVFLALFLGILICLIRMSNLTILKAIATAYVEIIRGVPLLLQLLVIYVILGPTKIHIGSFFTTEVLSCIIALFINSGAYTSEIFRSGLQAVDKGQMEAGRALGLGYWPVMKKIIIPQGIRNSLPSLVNELITMIKETSLAVSVDASIGELMSVRKQITAATYINLPPYIIAAMIYFCVTFSLSKLVGLIEKRLAARD